MKPNVWEYQHSDTQTSHFRGYVNTYQGATVTKVYAPQVRKSRLQAMKDAQKILKNLRKQNVTN